ncbi:unnamed protein product [Closterium sp. Yama58-4]|nr:unnamed protein product [Closterium sp. Yama58-4]
MQRSIRYKRASQEQRGTGPSSRISASGIPFSEPPREYRRRVRSEPVNSGILKSVTEQKGGMATGRGSTSGANSGNADLRRWGHAEGADTARSRPPGRGIVRSVSLTVTGTSQNEYADTAGNPGEVERAEWANRHEHGWIRRRMSDIGGIRGAGTGITGISGNGSRSISSFGMPRLVAGMDLAVPAEKEAWGMGRGEDAWDLERVGGAGWEGGDGGSLIDGVGDDVDGDVSDGVGGCGFGDSNEWWMDGDEMERAFLESLITGESFTGVADGSRLFVLSMMWRSPCHVASALCRAYACIVAAKAVAWVASLHLMEGALTRYKDREGEKHALTRYKDQEGESHAVTRYKDLGEEQHRLTRYKEHEGVQGAWIRYKGGEAGVGECSHAEAANHGLPRGGCGRSCERCREVLRGLGERPWGVSAKWFQGGRGGEDSGFGMPSLTDIESSTSESAGVECGVVQVGAVAGRGMVAERGREEAEGRRMVEERHEWAGEGREVVAAEGKEDFVTLGGFLASFEAELSAGRSGGGVELIGKREMEGAEEGEEKESEGGNKEGGEGRGGGEEREVGASIVEGEGRIEEEGRDEGWRVEGGRDVEGRRRKEGRVEEGRRGGEGGEWEREGLDCEVFEDAVSEAGSATLTVFESAVTGGGKGTDCDVFEEAVSEPFSAEHEDSDLTVLTLGRGGGGREGKGTILSDLHGDPRREHGEQEAARRAGIGKEGDEGEDGEEEGEDGMKGSEEVGMGRGEGTSDWLRLSVGMECSRESPRVIDFMGSSFNNGSDSLEDRAIPRGTSLASPRGTASGSPRGKALAWPHATCQHAHAGSPPSSCDLRELVSRQQGQIEELRWLLGQQMDACHALAAALRLQQQERQHLGRQGGQGFGGLKNTRELTPQETKLGESKSEEADGEDGEEGAEEAGGDSGGGWSEGAELTFESTQKSTRAEEAGGERGKGVRDSGGGGIEGAGQWKDVDWDDELMQQSGELRGDIGSLKDQVGCDRGTGTEEVAGVKKQELMQQSGELQGDISYLAYLYSPMPLLAPSMQLAQRASRIASLKQSLLHTMAQLNSRSPSPNPYSPSLPLMQRASRIASLKQSLLHTMAQLNSRSPSPNPYSPSLPVCVFPITPCSLRKGPGTSHHSSSRSFTPWLSSSPARPPLAPPSPFLPCTSPPSPRPPYNPPLANPRLPSSHPSTRPLISPLLFARILRLPGTPPCFRPAPPLTPIKEPRA